MGLPKKYSDKILQKCTTVLNNNGIAVVATDTVYGVVCKASSESAVKKLYELKSREKKPGTVVASSIDQLVELGIKRRYLTAVAQFWPNPISIQIPHDLSYLNQGTGRQAFRVTNDQGFNKLLDKTGPLLTSSANLPGEPTASNIKQAESYFGPKVDFYLDGGEAKDNQPSTLIRVVDDAVEILREGAVRVNEKGEIEP